MNILRKSLSVILLGSLACAAQAEVKTVTPGVLKVGMDITYPPFESFDGDKVVGSDPDFASDLAKQLGLKADFVNTEFAGLILGLKANHFDTVISGMYITPERTAQALAIPYARTGAAIMTKAGAAKEPKVPEDLCGLKVGLQRGTTWVAKLQKLSTDYCVTQGKGAIAVSEFPSAPEATQAMLAGNVDAQMEIGGAASQIVERSRGRVRITSPELVYKETLGIYLRKDNEALKQALEEAFAKVRASGEYAALLKKYNLEDVPAN